MCPAIVSSGCGRAFKKPYVIKEPTLENVKMQENVVLPSKAALIGWVICGLAAVFYCYEYLLRIQPSVMVPELMRQFSISADKFGVIISLYYIAYTPMQVVVGVMTDLYGPRYILSFAVIVCTIGSFLFAIADNLYLAGAGRFLIGFGSAFAFVSALKLASIWLPLNRFALFAGLVTALGMVGGMVGAIGLTHLVKVVGWKATVYGGSILGAILTPIIWMVIRDKQEASATKQSSKIAYKETFYGLKVILFNWQAWAAGLVGCVLYMSLSVFAELWGIPFLKEVYHLDPNQAAVTVSMVFLGWLIGAPLTGWISDRIQKRRFPLLFGCILSAIAISWVIYFPNTPLILVKVLLFLFGVFSSIEVVCFAVGRETSPRHVSGAAVSFINLLVMLGGMAFQPLVGKFLDMNWAGQMEQGIRVYGVHGYQIALSILPISMVVGVLLTLVMRESFENASLTHEK
jgi:MFS family permease